MVLSRRTVSSTFLHLERIMTIGSLPLLLPPPLVIPPPAALVPYPNFHSLLNFLSFSVPAPPRTLYLLCSGGGHTISYLCHFVLFTSFFPLSPRLPTLSAIFLAPFPFSSHVDPLIVHNPLFPVYSSFPFSPPSSPRFIDPSSLSTSPSSPLNRRIL